MYCFQKLISCALIVFSISLAPPVIAQSTSSANARSDAAIRARVNIGVVSLITGGLEYASNTYGALARDLAGVLDEPGKLRILPIMGYGAVRNVEDMLYLRGIDVGMMHSDVLKYLELTGQLSGAKSRLRLLTKLYDEPFHVIARKDIASIADLDGKRVAIGPANSGSDISNRVLINALEIKPKLVNLTLNEASKQLKAGKLAALIYPTRKGSTFVRLLGGETNLHLLSLPATDKALQTYTTVAFTHDDYPGFVADGETIASLQMAAVLAVFNWSPQGARYGQVRQFITAFMNQHEALRKDGFHPVWKTLDLAANVKGWQRYGPAESVLNKLIEDGRVSLRGDANAFASAMAPIREYFTGYVANQTGSVATALSAEQRAKLFDKFLTWPNNPIEVKVVMRLTTKAGVGKVLGTITALNTEISIGGRKETALLLRPNLNGLKPGAYAFHVHGKPLCGPGRKDGESVPGLAAGGHLWLTGTGRFAGIKFGAHLGDLPDLEVGADGAATKEMIAPRLSLADLANRALMIHASQDDASGRMACGPIK